jgi:hypothetical protein
MSSDVSAQPSARTPDVGTLDMSLEVVVGRPGR